MEHIDIRPATEADVQAMSELLTELFTIESDFTPARKTQQHGLLLLVLQYERACVFVAEVKQTIVAMCSAQIVVSTAEGGPSAWLEDLIVHHDYRGKGIGAMLLARVEQWCRDHNVTRLQLLADIDNHAALDFYQRMGWGSTRLSAWRKKL